MRVLATDRIFAASSMTPGTTREDYSSAFERSRWSVTKIGVWLIGAQGNLASTVVLGALAGARRLATGGGKPAVGADRGGDPRRGADGRRPHCREVVSLPELRWRERLMPEKRTGSWFRKLFAGLADDEWDRLVAALASDEVQSLVKSKAKFNWHSAAIPLMLKQPGIKSILLRSFFR